MATDHPPTATCPMCRGWGTRGEYRAGRITVMTCELCCGEGRTVAPAEDEEEA